MCSKFLSLLAGKSPRKIEKIGKIEKTISIMENRVVSMEDKLRQLLEEIEELKKEYDDEMDIIKKTYRID